MKNKKVRIAYFRKWYGEYDLVVEHKSNHTGKRIKRFLLQSMCKMDTDKFLSQSLIKKLSDRDSEWVKVRITVEEM